MKILRLTHFIEFLFLLLMVLAVLIPASPQNMPVASRDSGVFLYTGWRLSQGDIPYKDVWDHKPPLIFFVNALGLLLSNNSRWGVWVIEVMSLMTAAVLGFTLFRKAFNTLTAYVASFLWLSTLVFMLEGGNYTTEYTLPLQFAFLWLIWKSEEKEAPRRYDLFLGILMGLLFFMKQNTIGIPLSVLLYVFLSRSYKKDWKGLFATTGKVLVGFGLVCLFLALFFLINNSLGHFWDQSFSYNFFYISGNSIVAKIQSGYRGLLLLFRTSLGLLGFIGWGIALSILLVSKKYIKPELIPLLSVGIINLPVELIISSLGGRLINHYFMTLLPVVSFFSAFTVYVLFEGVFSWLHIPSEKLKLRISIVALLFIFPMVHFKYAKDYFDIFMAYRDDSAQTAKVIDYLENNTTPEDTLLMLKAETYVNFATKRLSPDKYIYQYPLETRDYSTPKMVEGFLHDVISNKPAFIADKVGDWLQEQNYPVQSAEIDKLISEIDEMYEFDQVIGSWTIYKLVER